MPKYRVPEHPGFRVIAATERSQAAAMTLEPGEVAGGADNRHPDADQWLYVLSGTGEAEVGGERLRLGAGDLVLIEAGSAHEIRAGDEELVTLSVYAPPAY